MRPRPFQLMVDAASHEEPATRYFGSLDAALAAMRELPERWHPFVWIVELGEGRPVVHIKDGRRL